MSETTGIIALQYPATDDTTTGKPVELDSTKAIPDEPTTIPCPYCHEHLERSVSVIGRAVSDAKQHFGDWQVLVQHTPDTHECLWCNTCGQAFFQLKAEAE